MLPLICSLHNATVLSFLSVTVWQFVLICRRDLRLKRCQVTGSPIRLPILTLVSTIKPSQAVTWTQTGAAVAPRSKCDACDKTTMTWDSQSEAVQRPWRHIPSNYLTHCQKKKKKLLSTTIICACLNMSTFQPTRTPNSKLCCFKSYDRFLELNLIYIFLKWDFKFIFFQLDIHALI